MSFPDVSKMIVQMRMYSNELLLKWTAYFLVHKFVTSMHPVLGNYGVPLKASSLQYLVLSNRKLTEVMPTAASYLNDNSKEGEEIFSLRPNDKAFEMAKKYGEIINPSLNQIGAKTYLDE